MPFPFSVLLDLYYYLPDILKPKKNAQFTVLGTDAPSSCRTTRGLSEDKGEGANSCTGAEERVCGAKGGRRLGFLLGCTEALISTVFTKCQVEVIILVFQG